MKWGLEFGGGNSAVYILEKAQVVPCQGQVYTEEKAG